MATAFQSNAFQTNAFQIDAETPEPGASSTAVTQGKIRPMPILHNRPSKIKVRIFR